jgi:tetratricopeptide (TPR) repeat protein
MSTEQNNWPALKRQIAAWSVVTKDHEVPIGLEAEEARRRAHELVHAILVGEASPDSVTIDDDTKHVLSLVVSLLSDAPAETRLHDANAIYHFIRRLPWRQDAFGEQQDLLLECAEIGWASIGLSLADIELSRRTAEADGQPMHDFGTHLVSSFDLAERRPASGMDSDAEVMHQLRADPNSTEALAAVSRLLRQEWNSRPAFVAEQACLAYRRLTNFDSKCGLFDERDYYLGEMALLAGGAFHLVGQRDEAEAWLERADAGFRHTLNPTPQLAHVSYLRLAVRYSRRRYDEVLELIPSVQESFERLGMGEYAGKARFLEAMTLKESERLREAFEKFSGLKASLDESRDGGTLGQVLVETGAVAAAEGNFEEALADYERALPLLKRSGRGFAIPHLLLSIGDMFRHQGRLAAAINSFREAIKGYASFDMATFVAYSRVIMAETLIAIGRPREAEWEILQALPTIKEQKMVPEGFAAVALLRESVKRQKADPNALRELREHLQKQH